MLSVKFLARIAGKSQVQRRRVGSNAISFASDSAATNWMVKKGLPPVFSWTRCERGSTRPTSQTSASASSPPDVVEIERREDQLVHPRAGRLDAFERSRESVGLANLVVAVGADDEKVSDLRVRDDVLEKSRVAAVDPLQVIEEERERLFLRGNDAEEPPEHHLESVLRLLRRKLRYGRLLADDELDLRNEVRYQLPVRAERASNGIAPLTELGVALAQQRADDAPQGLRGRSHRECHACTGRTFRSRTGRAQRSTTS